MAVLSGALLSREATKTRAKARPNERRGRVKNKNPQSPRDFWSRPPDRPPILLSAPNQNRHATQARKLPACRRLLFPLLHAEKGTRLATALPRRTFDREHYLSWGLHFEFHLSKVPFFLCRVLLVSFISLSYAVTIFCPLMLKNDSSLRLKQLFLW